MRKYLILIAVLILVILMAECRSTVEKRVNKDIIGINEQLYELEKNQIKNANQIKKIEGEFKSLKMEETPNTPAEKNDEFDRVYKMGYKNYLEQNFQEAIKIFSQLTAQFKSDSLIDNALYWQAESYSKLDQNDAALNYYQLIYRYFPFSNKADYALYKIGLIYTDMKDYSKAKLAFDRLVSEYPDSDLFKTVLEKIKELKKQRRRR